MKDFLIASAGIISCFGIFFGIIGAYSFEGNYTGCKYESIASFNPARIITCELLRKRFKK